MATESFYTESGSSPPIGVINHALLALRYLNGFYDEVLTEKEIVERKAMEAEHRRKAESIDLDALLAELKAKNAQEVQ